MSNEGEEQLTPIERPLLRSDLNDLRDVIHKMDTMLVAWYEENKTWHEQSDKLVKRVANIERRLWVPTVISSVAVVLALLARFAR